MRSAVRTLIFAAILAAAPAGAALAHRGGDDNRSAAGFAVTQGEAAAIARAEGMVQIYETKARRGVWKMEGVDASGIKIEVSVDGRTGEVVKVERYGPGTQRSGSDDRRPN